MNIIQLCAERAGLPTRAYTGRGMYKSKCLGIDCRSFASFLTKTMCQINGEDELNEYAEAIGGYMVDSMGMDIIVYFPSIQFSDSYEDEDELDDQEA